MMKDWECKTKGCGHLPYRHNNEGRSKGCGVVLGASKKSAGKLCPCTGYKPKKKGLKWI